MIINSNDAEMRTAIDIADKMMTAARTAPKAHGDDSILTIAVTGNEKEELAKITKKLGEEYNQDFMIRDAKMIKHCPIVVLIGIKKEVANVNQVCQFCGYSHCGECISKDGNCALKITDLGIALGSAVSIAADNRVDSRIFFSAGKAAVISKIFKEDIRVCYAIPINISGKSIFFDRAGTPQLNNVEV